MKCPYCDYRDSTQYFDGTIVVGSEGNFFKLSTAMTRPEPSKETVYRSISVTATLYGCPECFKTFIETS